MTEHLNADKLALRTTYVLTLNLLKDVGHLVHVKLAGKHHYIGKLGIKLKSLSIADIKLCR